MANGRVLRRVLEPVGSRRHAPVTLGEQTHDPQVPGARRQMQRRVAKDVPVLARCGHAGRSERTDGRERAKPGRHVHGVAITPRDGLGITVVTAVANQVRDQLCLPALRSDQKRQK